MRSLAVALVFALGLHATTAASAQATNTCTGLCLQQLPIGSCPAGGPATTTITGTVYAPNGTDPLPNVTVYIPNAPVDPFTPGVSCPIVGTPPSGSPLVGTTTAVDGTFTLTDVPVGTNIPLVIVSGRWRRQIVIPATTGCANTAADPTMTRFPRTQAEGDIPLFAVATGSVDSVECVLRKVGIADSEFTNPSGGGRIQLYAGSGSAGTRIDATTPTQDSLMSNLTTLNQYDVLMLPCQGGQYAQTSTAESNFDTFVNNGGRVYSSHYSYVWMYYPSYTNGPFAGVANWQVNDGSYPDGTATINTTFAGGQTLAQWLAQPAINASTSLGQMPINTLKHDLQAPNGVIAPTQSWMTLNTTTAPVMQFVFDAPIGATNQCGRVLYNEYHVESNSSTGTIFPKECTNAAITPQEKLLEFMLFELTDQGGAATLTPTVQDFGSIAVGFSSAPIAFTVTNKSTFSINGAQIITSGDFNVSSNNCASIGAGASCTINVVFSPTALGARTGTLSVNAGATSLLANLTGTGIPVFTISPTSLTYGSFDVGASSTQNVTVSNNATGAVPVPGFIATANFSVKSNCPSSLAAGASCILQVTFTPTTTGPLTGTLTPNSNNAAYANISVALTGTGVDFTIVATPTSGKVIAGDSLSFSTLASPIAGFDSSISLTCSTNAPGSTCSLAATSFGLGNPVTTAVKITTTSKYTVIGYTGGSTGLLAILAAASGLLLWITRRRTSALLRPGLLRIGMVLAAFGLASLALSGCSSKTPAQNAVYTPAGSYTYTVTATDGFLIHSATYALTVTAN